MDNRDIPSPPTRPGPPALPEPRLHSPPTAPYRIGSCQNAGQKTGGRSIPLLPPIRPGPPAPPEPRLHSPPTAPSAESTVVRMRNKKPTAGTPPSADVARPSRVPESPSPLPVNCPSRRRRGPDLLRPRKPVPTLRQLPPAESTLVRMRGKKCEAKNRRQEYPPPPTWPGPPAPPEPRLHSPPTAPSAEPTVIRMRGKKMRGKKPAAGTSPFHRLHGPALPRPRKPVPIPRPRNPSPFPANCPPAEAAVYRMQGIKPTNLPLLPAKR